MDTTIRNLDERIYRRIRARALASGKTVGEAVNEAMRVYLARPDVEKTTSLRDLVPRPFPDGSDRLSEEIDDIVYGAR